MGDRVTIKSGVQLWDGCRVEDNVFIGPNVSFSNDRMPRSTVRPPAFAGVLLENGASIGAGAVVLPGIRVGQGALVGAGAIVSKDVPALAVVRGDPSTVTRYLRADDPVAPPQLPQ